MKWAAAVKGPVYLRMVRGASPFVSKGFEAGKAQVLRKGKEVSIIACGPMVHRSLLAAEMLEKTGVDAEVINASSIKPLDAEAIISSAKKTGLVVTAEEHSVYGGLGGAVAELLSEAHPAKIVRVGVKDRFGSSARAEADVVKLLGLTENDVFNAAKQAMA
jgi:transketolase